MTSTLLTVSYESTHPLAASIPPPFPDDEDYLYFEQYHYMTVRVFQEPKIMSMVKAYWANQQRVLWSCYEEDQRSLMGLLQPWVYYDEDASRFFYANFQ